MATIRSPAPRIRGGGAAVNIPPRQKFHRQTISDTMLALGCQRDHDLFLHQPQDITTRSGCLRTRPLRKSAVIIRTRSGEDTSIMRTTALPVHAGGPRRATTTTATRPRASSSSPANTSPQRRTNCRLKRRPWWLACTATTQISSPSRAWRNSCLEKLLRHGL